MFYNKQKGGFPSLNIPGASDMLGNPEAMPQTMQAGDREFQIAPMKDPAMPPAIKPKAWGKDGKAWKILGIIGDALQTAGGGRATYMPAYLDLQEQTRKERETQQALAAKAQALSGLGLTPEQQQAVMSGVADYGDLKGAGPTQMQLNYEYAKQQMPGLTYPQFMAMYHPQFISGPDGQYQVQQGAPAGVPEGLTPMAPEEVQALGLGNGPNPAPQPQQPSQGQSPAFVSRADLVRLQQALGGPQQVQEYLRKHNITVGN